MKKNKLLTLLLALLVNGLTIHAQDAVFTKEHFVSTPGAAVPSSSLHIGENQINTIGKSHFIIQPQHTFSCFGIGWDIPSADIQLADLKVSFRTQFQNGKWSKWSEVEAEVAATETPTGIYWTDALFTTDATSHLTLEIIISYPIVPNALKINLFDGTQTGSISNPVKPTSNATDKALNCPVMPTMITRSQWCGGAAACSQVNAAYTPTYINASHVIIHHGATPDTYTSGQEVVQSYYNYHVNTLGWTDIGYNYLVDKNGNFFQGRHNPSISTSDVRGAHAGTSNGTSIGINFPGNADVTIATTAQIQVVNKLLAWWFDKKGWDPTSSASMLTQDYGTLTLPRISGHKDIGQTSCPGTDLYSRIPSMRNAAKQIITDCNTCGTPSGLSANSISNNSAVLSWLAQTNTSSYTIQYKPSSSTTWTTTTSTTNSKSITGLNHSTSYDFKVMSNCSGTSSVYSGIKTFTTTAPPPIVATIGTGTTPYSGHPYSASFMDERSQYIITNSELTAAGWSSSNPYLQSIAFYVSTPGNTAMSNFTIRVSNTSATNFTSSNYYAGSTTSSTFTGTVNPVAGWNTYTFPTPYLYDPSMSLLITVCFDNSVTGTNTIVNSTVLSEYKSLFNRNNLSTGNICSTASGTQSYYRPNMQLVFHATASSSGGTVAAKSAMISPATSEGISEFSIYPNPATNFTTIQLDKATEHTTLYIFDSYGSVISQYDLSNEMEYTIDLSQFSKGMYLFKIGNLTKRFIKID